MSSHPTRTFGFLMFPAFEELDLVGPWEMATMWRDTAKGPACVTVSELGGPVTCAKGLRTVADVSFADCPPLASMYSRPAASVSLSPRPLTARG